MTNKFDLIIFGSTSELIQAIVKEHKQWFLDNVNELTVVQRTDSFPEIYKEFNPKSIKLDCSNAQNFGSELKNIAETFSLQVQIDFAGSFHCPSLYKLLKLSLTFFATAMNFS